jgi:hypothetical protein
MPRWKNRRGFSATETTAIIAATSILSATATPQIHQYLESARGVKAAGDTRVIAISIVRLTSDVGRVRQARTAAPTLLVSDGEVPHARFPAAQPWALPLDGRTVQPLASHLIDNAADYPGQPGQPIQWRGPYMGGLTPDPWGKRYAVNIGLMDGSSGAVVFVLSPGPNGIVETPFEAIGMKTGGDDVVGVIGRGR